MISGLSYSAHHFTVDYLDRSRISMDLARIPPHAQLESQSSSHCLAGGRHRVDARTV